LPKGVCGFDGPAKGITIIQMIRPTLLTLSLVLLPLLCATGARNALADPPPEGEGSRPNVIVILTDDMGYSDLGAYGGEIQTPVLDELAEEGLKFTQFYNTARCCPTRASLLTGLYPHQAGVGHMTGSPRDLPGYPNQLHKNTPTIAEVLRPGYRTYMVGKWHVSHNGGNYNGNKRNWPMQRGFEKFYGIVGGASNYFDNRVGFKSALTRGNERVDVGEDPQYKPEVFYMTDAFTDHAVRYIGEHVEESPGDPFFMYVAYTAAHWPMHALPEDIARYEGVYTDGYEPIRKARFERQKQLGLIPEDAALSSAEGEGHWPEDPEYQAWEANNMAVYAAMVDRMDQGVGKIVESLKEQGLLENTLILFMQDNGGCAENYGRGGEGDGGWARDGQQFPAKEDLITATGAGGPT
jgi:arylsulfatase